MIVVHAYAWHFIEEKLAPHVELLDCLLKPPSYETVSSVISRLSSQTSVWPAYLAVGGGDRQANVRSNHDSQGWGQFDAKTTAGGERKKTHVDVSEQL